MKKSGIMPYVLLIIVAILFLFVTLFVGISNSYNNSAHKLYTSLDFNGTYVADSKEEVALNSVKDFKDKRYENVVFKGKFSKEIPSDQYLILSVCNVWLEVKVNGEVVATNIIDSNIKTDTPGYSILYVEGEEINNNDVELNFKNPYNSMRRIDPIKKTLESAYCGEKDSPYQRLFQDNTISLVVGLFICFLGILALSLAGLLSKEFLLRNIALGGFALIGGCYILIDCVYLYFPMWIENPVLCLLIGVLPLYLLPPTAFVYLGEFSEFKRTKNYMTALTVVTLLIAITAFTSHFVGLADVIIFERSLLIFTFFGILSSFFILIYDSFFKKSKQTRVFLYSMAPLFVTSVFDLVNSVLIAIPELYTMRFGLLLTIGAQLYFLFAQTVKQSKELARFNEMQHELLQMRVAIMVSQIQPHFLYNSLTSIAQLCEKDPKLAKKSTIQFADYMRRNMNSLKDQSPVSFKSELNHLKTYLSLEKMRFGDELDIVFDIETTDFSIPSLTVQPLVENAVKHGVGMKEDGGTVTIATREYDTHYEITVSDDGVGFDINKKPSDNRSHVGMENVKNRLSTMCNATVEINSKKGVGTVAKIKIPKKE